MDSQGYIQSFIGKMFLHGLNDCRDFICQGAAVCITEHQAFRSSLHRFIQGSQCIFAVLFEPVKKMLSIVKKMLNMGFQKAQRLDDYQQIVFKADTQCIPDMHIPGFAKNSYPRGFGIDQGQ